MGELFDGGGNVPITEQPAINAQEVEAEIRARVNKYSSEELIREITAYCLETVVEVVMSKYVEPHHLDRIERMDHTEIHLLQEMSRVVSE